MGLKVLLNKAKDAAVAAKEKAEQAIADHVCPVKVPDGLYKV